MAVVTMLTVAASAQISAPQVPPPDQPAISIRSDFVRVDGGVQVVKNVTIDVAGVSIEGAAGRLRGYSQITLENATITISPDVATHVRGRMIYRAGKIIDVPLAR